MRIGVGAVGLYAPEFIRARTSARSGTPPVGGSLELVGSRRFERKGPKPGTETEVWVGDSHVTRLTCLRRRISAPSARALEGVAASACLVSPPSVRRTARPQRQPGISRLTHSGGSFARRLGSQTLFPIARQAHPTPFPGVNQAVVHGVSAVRRGARPRVLGSFADDARADRIQVDIGQRRDQVCGA